MALGDAQNLIFTSHQHFGHVAWRNALANCGTTSLDFDAKDRLADKSVLPPSEARAGRSRYAMGWNAIWRVGLRGHHGLIGHHGLTRVRPCACLIHGPHHGRLAHHLVVLGGMLWSNELFPFLVVLRRLRNRRARPSMEHIPQAKRHQTEQQANEQHEQHPHPPRSTSAIRRVCGRERAGEGCGGGGGRRQLFNCRGPSGYIRRSCAIDAGKFIPHSHLDQVTIQLCRKAGGCD